MWRCNKWSCGANALAPGNLHQHANANGYQLRTSNLINKAVSLLLSLPQLANQSTQIDFNPILDIIQASLCRFTPLGHKAKPFSWILFPYMGPLIIFCNDNQNPKCLRSCYKNRVYSHVHKGRSGKGFYTRWDSGNSRNIQTLYYRKHSQRNGSHSVVKLKMHKEASPCHWVVPQKWNNQVCNLGL